MKIKTGSFLTHHDYGAQTTLPAADLSTLAQIHSAQLLTRGANTQSHNGQIQFALEVFYAGSIAKRTMQTEAQFSTSTERHTCFVPLAYLPLRSQISYPTQKRMALQNLQNEQPQRVMARHPVRISVTISHGLYQELLRRSDHEGRSLSNLSAFLLEGAVDEINRSSEGA